MARYEKNLRGRFAHFTVRHPETLRVRHTEGASPKDLAEKGLTLKTAWDRYFRLCPRYDGKKKAFTLAEVLITLGIIGVIAAITIPAVIQNTQSQEAVVKLKKAYNTLKMVERQATVDHGPMSEWAWKGNLTDFDTFFKPYFDIMKDCGKGTGCWGKEYYRLNDTLYVSNFDSRTDIYKFITADGISFDYWAYSVTTGVVRRGTFSVDLNGSKGPNKIGRDVFSFDVLPTRGIKPQGTYNPGSAEPNNSATIDTACVTSGDNCAAKVLSEGAINY